MLQLSTSDKLLYKQRLKAHCASLLQNRIDTARQAMEAAQESANNEGKSSAGDKYETGRAMSQIDRDRSAGQLDEAIKDMLIFQSMDTERIHVEVQNGSVIISPDMIYFICTGLGVTTFEDARVVILSPKAPLSNFLRGKRKGDQVSFNGNNFAINDIF